MSEDVLVEFRTFTFVHEAELAASALESAGIDCSVRERYLAGSEPGLVEALGGVALLVRASDVESARAILDSQQPAAPDAADLAAEPGATCAGCGGTLRNAMEACRTCDAQPDRDIRVRPRWALVKLKLGLLIFTLLLIAAPLISDRLMQSLGAIPEKTLTYVLYGDVAIVLAALLIKGLASQSDRRL